MMPDIVFGSTCNCNMRYILAPFIRERDNLGRCIRYWTSELQPHEQLSSPWGYGGSKTGTAPQRLITWQMCKVKLIVLGADFMSLCALSGSELIRKKVRWSLYDLTTCLFILLFMNSVYVTFWQWYQNETTTLNSLHSKPCLSKCM